MCSIGLRVSFETCVCKLKKAALHKLRNAAKFPKLRGVKVAGNSFRGKEEGHSDSRSRGLSHHSTRTDADGLDFRVRDGTG